MNNFIEHLEQDVNWNKVFGVVDCLYSDEGFTSNADNFARATAVEKALDKFSNLERVDGVGYDLLFGDKKVELKTKKNLLYKRKDPKATTKFKMKNFQGDKKTVKDYQNEKTFDYLLVIDLTARRVVIVDDNKARTLYEKGGDCIFISLKEGDYYECNLPFINVTLPSINLSTLYTQAVQTFLDF